MIEKGDKRAQRRFNRTMKVRRAYRVLSRSWFSSDLTEQEKLDSAKRLADNLKHCSCAAHGCCSGRKYNKRPTLREFKHHQAAVQECRELGLRPPKFRFGRF